MAARLTNSPGDWPSGAIGCASARPRPNRAPRRRVGAACRPGCLAKCKEVGERARQITLDTCRRNAKRPAKFPRWEEFALGLDTRPHPRSPRQNPISSRDAPDTEGFGGGAFQLRLTLESQTDSIQSKDVFWRIESPQAPVLTSEDFKVTSNIRGFSRLNRRAAAASRVLRPAGHDSSTSIPSRMVTRRSMR